MQDKFKIAINKLLFYKHNKITQLKKKVENYKLLTQTYFFSYNSIFISRNFKELGPLQGDCYMWGCVKLQMEPLDDINYWLTTKNG